MVLVLVDSEEPTGDEPVVPERDDFVIERVIGQHMIFSGEPVAAQYFLHERVYVTDVSPGAVSLRDLSSEREADTSFLWHQVTAWSAGWNNDTWGNWVASGLFTDNPGTSRIGGPGFRDIRVGRRVLEGQALVYHWQLEGAGVPTDSTFTLYPWFRTLLRKA